MTMYKEDRNIDKQGRIGYWPLLEDGRDVTALQRHGTLHGIEFADGAVFNGESSIVQLPELEETDGTKPFTVSMEFEVNDAGGKLPGGLISRYSEQEMKGWHVSVLTQAGVTSTQSNWRQLQFGWSGTGAADVWKDWGRPGESRFIGALCVYDGSLYAGTFDDASDGKGHVYRLEADGSWINCGSPDESNMVMSIVEYEGRLYAGTMRYRAAGSHIEGSGNTTPGGRIYRYEGGESWSFFAELPVPDNDSVGAMTVYDGKLIAMSFYPYGVFAYDQDGNCQSLGAPGPEGTTRSHTLAPFRGRLYIGCNELQGVYSRTMDEPWVYNGTVPKCDQVYCFATYHNELMMGIWREAKMYRFDGGTDWTDCGMMDEELEVMGVSVYNGKLYGGTLPGGFVYRYNGGNSWERVGELEEQDPDIEYRRVWTMAVYNGEMFAGTLPSGRVWSLKNDPLAIDSRSLTPGWHRATATYDKQELKLYLDGELVAVTACPEDGELSASGIPLAIGKGPQCHFSGRIRHVELFDHALTAGRIASCEEEKT